MRCIVFGCDVNASCTSSDGVSFHRFPTEPTLCKTWLKLVGKEGWVPSKNDVVCSKHFQKNDLFVTRDGRLTLRADAIPIADMQKAPKGDHWAQCELKVCRVCFAADCNLYSIKKFKNLDKAFEMVTGFPIENSNLPPYLCPVCSHRFLKCIQFRNRSIQANLIIQEIVQKQGYVTLEAIRSSNKYSLLNSEMDTYKQVNHYDLDIKHVEEKLHDDEQECPVDLSNLYNSNVVKVEKNDSLHQDIKKDSAVNDSMCPPRLHEVTLPGIKLEADDFYDQNNPTIDTTYSTNIVGIRIKVEPMEIGNEDCAEDTIDDAGRVLCKNESTGEDYSSDNVVLEEQQKLKHGTQIKSRAGTHIKTYSGKKLYACDVCEKTFKQRYNLSNHLKSHSGVKPYSCDICKKGFSQKYNLVSHLRKHSGEKPYACNICGKTFIVRNVLKAHLRTHTGEKPYSCKLCDKVFSQRANLSAHSKIHSGEKPYSCDICKKGFTQRCNLIAHSRTHSGEKPYSCNVCEVSFRRNYHLKSHLKMHSGEKSYVCEICKKAFYGQSNLHKHMYIHSDVKLYSCKICNKEFNRKGNLNTHIKIHSNEKPYSCVLCKKEFRRKDHLQIHIKRHNDTLLDVSTLFDKSI